MKISAEATRLVGAPADKVYAILINPDHHKKILPEAFSKFEVEPDGIWKCEVNAGFMRRTLRVVPEQVEENRHYREKDLTTNAITDFLLEAHPDGTLVTISTIYERPGFLGFLESLIAPGFMRKLFDEELIKLCRYALIAET